MIKVYPSFEKCLDYLDFEYKVERVLYSGMRTFAVISDCNGKKYYADVPIGHGTLYPFIYQLEQKNILPEKRDNWYFRSLERTIKSIPENFEFPIKVTFEKKFNDLIIINCIDIYYGHSLLKLLNASYYLKKYREKDILVIVPSFLEWYVPKSCNKLVVDINLREGHKHIVNLNQNIHELSALYDNVFLSKAYSTPHPNDIDLSLHNEEITAKNHDRIVSENAKVAFIWREDRTIFAGTFVENLSIFLKNKLRIVFLQKVLVLLQVIYLNKLFEKILKEKPDMKVFVIGFGKGRYMNKRIKKRLTVAPSAKTDLEWLEMYSNMDVVVGVHGSNMLLPSAYAGMTLELLPKDRIGNFMQDITYKRNQDIRDGFFRYRFVPSRTKKSYVSEVILSMLDKYDNFRLQMIEQVYND